MARVQHDPAVTYAPSCNGGDRSNTGDQNRGRTARVSRQRATIGKKASDLLNLDLLRFDQSVVRRVHALKPTVHTVKVVTVHWASVGQHRPPLST